MEQNLHIVVRGIERLGFFPQHIDQVFASARVRRDEGRGKEEVGDVPVLRDEVAVHQGERTHARVRGDTVDEGLAQPQGVGFGHFEEQRVLHLFEIPLHLLPGMFRGDEGVEPGVDAGVDEGREMRQDDILDGHQIDVLGVVEDAVDIVRERIPAQERGGEFVRALEKTVELDPLFPVAGRNLHENLILDTQAAEGEAFLGRTRRRDQLGDILLEADLQAKPYEHHRRNGDDRIHQGPVAPEEAV